MPTALAFTTWAYALARSTAGRLGGWAAGRLGGWAAGRLGGTTYLVPPVAIVLGWALLGEVPALSPPSAGESCASPASRCPAAPRRRGERSGPLRSPGRLGPPVPPGRWRRRTRNDMMI
jgi:hypothetical protein